tara:strand:- start:96 stop:518 length:423 start_codon:yes stop_codon:yes gene_type:complete
MMGPIYRHFIGNWELVAETCIYEQGETPVAGTYRIEESGGELVFHLGWRDKAGEDHQYSFSTIPDGMPHDFNGGDLADSLSVTAVSEEELNSAAYYKGKELMLAARTLVDGGMYMDVRQIVRLPDGTEPTNYSRYRRVPH